MSKSALNIQALMRLLSELKPHKAKIVVVLVLGMCVSAVQPVAVKFVEKVIDQIQTGIQPGYFSTVPTIIIGLFAFSGLVKFFHNIYRRELSERLLIKLRSDLFHRYLSMPMTKLNQKRTGELLSGIQNDLVYIGMGLDTLCDLVKEPVAFVGLLGVAFYSDWRLALCTLAVVPLAGFLFARSGEAVKRYSSKNLSHFSDIVSVCQETVVGASIIKVFRMEPTLSKKFAKIQEDYFSALWKSIRVQEIATPAVEFIGAVLIAVVLAYGGYRISSGEMTSGNLVAFVIAIGLAQMPLKKLNNAFLKLRIAEAAAERVYSLLEGQRVVEHQSGSIRKHRLESSIEFKNVTLDYESKTVLKGVSLKVARGECLALVGQSGGGKTSIVNLLPRLYDVSGGSIEMDGVDIRDIYLGDLRDLISVVSQDVFLFNDTIYENIRYARPHATESEIKSAAESALCLDFVSRFPDGFDTRVGDRGGNLSGGERQRVAIARALLKNSPILILDEATSNLDSRSEAKVQKALEILMEDKTTFVVAHRLSTVRKADQILVIEDGRIRESGTHSLLMEGAGLYRQFVEHQLLQS